MLVMKGIYRTGTPWEEEWSIYRRQEMSGPGYNADRYEEIDDAIRFAHEGGTQWASADNREKKIWLSLEQMLMKKL